MPRKADNSVSPVGALYLRAAAAEPTSLRISGACEGFELEAAAAEGGNRLRKFRMTAYTGVAMRVGFAWPVVVDLAGLAVPGQRRPILRDHDPEQIVGHSESISVSEQRLKLSGVLSGVGPAAQEVLQLAANDFPWQASIGASIERLEFVDRDQTVKVNGRSFSGPIYVARATTLGEVSFVPMGADPNTAAEVAAQRREGPMTFEQWLAAKGFDVATLSDAQKLALQAAWKAEQTPAPTPTPAPAPTVPSPSPAGQTYEAVIAARRAEEERRNAITQIVANTIKDRPDMLDEIEALARTAIGTTENDRWTVAQFELEVLRASRPKLPAIISRPSGRNGVPEDPAIIEAAVCSAGKLPDLEKQFSGPVLEASRRHWRNGLGLGELILTFAHRGGYQGLSIKGGDLKTILKSAFATDIRAGVWGPSSYDLSSILANVANKFLRVAFEAVDPVWRMITATRSANDFKTISSYSLTGDMQYELIPPGGEIKHGTASSTSYTNKVDSYGKIFGVDRRDLINDDLGALTRLGTRMGRGGALKINDIFWSIFLNNSTFFASGNSNVITGAGSALSLTSLQDADRVFRLQTDPDGKPLGIMPRKLVVPTALRITALNLMNSINVVSTTTANAPLPDGNPFAGAFDVVSSPYMSNSSYTGNSATAWYLLADPNDLPVIETAFLNGQELPTVESFDAELNMLGIAFRGFHDFGVALQEYRGGVRAAGA